MSRFTDAELEVMRILWQGGAMKPPEILEQFPRPVSDSTLRSFLTTLLEKGHVARVRQGRAFYYKATTHQESAFCAWLKRTLDVFCEGSYAVLVKRLVSTQNLSAEELAELRRVVAEADGAAPAES